MDRYNFKKTETKWQKEWVKSELYKSEIDRSKPKYYVLRCFHIHLEEFIWDT